MRTTPSPHFNRTITVHLLNDTPYRPMSPTNPEPRPLKLQFNLATNDAWITYDYDQDTSAFRAPRMSEELLVTWRMPAVTRDAANQILNDAATEFAHIARNWSLPDWDEIDFGDAHTSVSLVRSMIGGLPHEDKLTVSRISWAVAPAVFAQAVDEVRRFGHFLNGHTIAAEREVKATLGARESDIIVDLAEQIDAALASYTNPDEQEDTHQTNPALTAA